AKANQLLGHHDRRVVAVIGDGALTGGMAWEALNNIAEAHDRPLVIVVNDNERSYARTIGGLANHLATLRTTQGYERFLAWGREALQRTPVVGRPVLGALHGAKKGFKDSFAPQGMFEDLGLKYIGPIDGHDTAAVESALERARGFGGPVIVHCLTEKGRGYGPAEKDDADHFHAVGAMDPFTCLPLSPSKGTSWTSVFGDEMAAVGRDRPDVVAITAAMLQPVGLAKFAEAHPDRVFDVGIAEQHAAVSAAGLATGGLHPVVAVYATFLNRAFDQVLMDVALHRLGVTFVLDRAGVTGNDGASHNGMWDMSVLQVVPGLRLAAPRDADQLRAQLREALDVDDAPTVVRFPKAEVGPVIPAVERIGTLDVLRRTTPPGGSPADPPDVLLVAVGSMAQPCLDAAALLTAEGLSATVVDPRWVKPVDPALARLAAGHRLVVTVEDNGRTSGVGSAVAQALRDADVDIPVRELGIPQRFLAHAGRGEILNEIGLTGPGIAAQTAAFVRGLRPAVRAGAVRGGGSGGSAASAGRVPVRRNRTAEAARTRGGDPHRGL
ncbi:1-deoxy-D-xylulose-5-phosphate synthase N-terminal domain-containing protein, partial [Peterkaempfera griseoplana]|uniref:1-deoxy-D-xylulose-5-phosphate synthase N-terminal domain-containing protein n=1 Tax=Peterkaempfera griseoplana TaxID=66896 RepID=UPI0006E44803